jgi:hypothetical protein
MVRSRLRPWDGDNLISWKSFRLIPLRRNSLGSNYKVIGIGRDFEAPPSHTTVHTVPYTAVRLVKRSSSSLIREPRAS